MNLGFKQGHVDHTLFTHITDSSYVALLIYVGDIVLVGDHLSDLFHIKSTLDENSGNKDLGILKFFLRFEVAHSPLGISLC